MVLLDVQFVFPNVRTPQNFPFFVKTCLYIAAPAHAPSTGPTVYIHHPFESEAPPHPASAVTSRGPRSRAGFIPAPVTQPNWLTRVPTVSPMSAGAAPFGTAVLSASVSAKIMKARAAANTCEGKSFKRR